MAAAPSSLVHLPSGRRVRIHASPAAPRAKKKPLARRQRALFDDVRELLRSGALWVEEPKSGARLDEAAIEAMPLADFHVLRDFAIRSQLVSPAPEEFPCDNCDHPLTFDGSRLKVADLADRYRDEPASEELLVPLPEPLALGGGRRATHVRMKPVTVSEAAPLFRELARDRPFRITPPLLRALGVVRLEGGTTVTDPRAIARALSDGSDESWSAVEAGFLSLAYPARAVAVLACPKCETVHELDVPWPRELDPSQYHPIRDASQTFPSAEDFEDHVEAVAGRVFERMDVAGMTLRVEPGVPEVDSGGVPMLGSYAPEPAEGGRTEFVVTLYFRTFERAFKEDARFDWRAEVEETLEHEVQHHLYYLDGHDPMDEAERKESEEDAVRRAGGRARLRKLERAALARDVWAVARTLGPALIGLALTIVVFLRCS